MSYEMILAETVGRVAPPSWKSASSIITSLNKDEWRASRQREDV
jgi:hypothetical protein